MVLLGQIRSAAIIDNHVVLGSIEKSITFVKTVVWHCRRLVFLYTQLKAATTGAGN